VVCVCGGGSVACLAPPRTNPASRQRWWVKAEYDGGMCRRWYVQEAHQCSWAEDDIIPPMIWLQIIVEVVKKSSLFCPLKFR
jgi:hypothetical protein